MYTTLRRVTVSVFLAMAAISGFVPGVAHGAVEVNVRDFGAVGNGSADDTAAVQRANDAVARAGGGRVVFPAGIYMVHRVLMDSYVEFYGSGATLKHPDGYSSAIIYTRQRETIGSISKGSRTLRVANASGVRPGVAIAIRGAGPTIAGQSTAQPYHYSYVSSVSGNTLTIARAAPATVTYAEVHTGSMNFAIRGLTLDGNKPAEGFGSNVPVDLRLARRAVVSGNVIRNGLHGGVRLDLGSVENRIEGNQIIDSGRPGQRRGAAVWIFRGSSSNTVRYNKITGTHYLGIAVDDRSEDATDWDAPSNSNWISGNTIETAPAESNAAISVIGSSSNKIDNNTLRTVESGVLILASAQGENGRDARYNQTSNNVLSGHFLGLGVTGSQNAFSSNRMSSTAIPYLDYGTRNTFSG